MALEFYRCPHCGNIIVKTHNSGVPVVCCGAPMKKLEPNTGDGAGEKHVPQYDRNQFCIEVQVGEVLHPMLDNHYIEFIALETKSGFKVEYLKPGQEPKASFMVSSDEVVVAIYEYCNLHGLYKANY